ncbi:MAG: hypothetical protein KAW19_02835 [Candidatus Aminicenantes bacterium]|nr:hypothetical protein [Candidatus Aminicenantes bacterium]
MIEWIMSLPWLGIISIAIAIFVAVTSYLYARKALVRANKANEIAEKALSKTEIQFTTLNRPLLIIKPVSLKGENNYFNIDFLDKKKLIIKIPISIKNLGILVADNTFLHSTNCMLHINNKFITGDKKEHKTVNGKLTLMDIPPGGDVIKIVDFDFQLPPILDIDKFRTDLMSSCRMDTNFLLHYYSHYEKEKTLASNISYAISYNWYSILMMKL